MLRPTRRRAKQKLPFSPRSQVVLPTLPRWPRSKALAERESSPPQARATRSAVPAYELVTWARWRARAVSRSLRSAGASSQRSGARTRADITGPSLDREAKHGRAASGRGAPPARRLSRGSCARGTAPAGAAKYPWSAKPGAATKLGAPKPAAGDAQVASQLARASRGGSRARAPHLPSEHTTAGQSAFHGFPHAGPTHVSRYEPMGKCCFGHSLHERSA